MNVWNCSCSSHQLRPQTRDLLLFQIQNANCNITCHKSERHTTRNSAGTATCWADNAIAEEFVTTSRPSWWRSRRHITVLANGRERRLSGQFHNMIIKLWHLAYYMHITLITNCNSDKLFNILTMFTVLFTFACDHRNQTRHRYWIHCWAPATPVSKTCSRQSLAVEWCVRRLR